MSAPPPRRAAIGDSFLFAELFSPAEWTTDEQITHVAEQDLPSSLSGIRDWLYNESLNYDIIYIPLSLSYANSLRIVYFKHLRRINIRVVLFTASEQARRLVMEPLFDLYIDSVHTGVCEASHRVKEMYERGCVFLPADDLVKAIDPVLSCSCFCYGDSISSRHGPPHALTVEQFLRGLTREDFNKHLTKEAVVRDIYNIQNAGSVGPSSKSFNPQFGGSRSDLDNHDYERLEAELKKLSSALMQQATSPEQISEAGAVKVAQKAAKESDISTVTTSLKRTGIWALEVAQKIGVSLATDYLKNATGL